MTRVNWDIIDKVIFINLAKRKDRRVRILRHLKKLGFEKDKIIRLEAVEHNPGFIGCSLSHIAALEMAQQNEWKRVLILEDDFSFNETEDNYKNLNRYFDALRQTRWDVALLAANYQQVTTLKSVDYIIKVDKAWCACAYMVDSTYYNKLIHNYRAGVLSLLQGGSQQQYALDVNWHLCMAEDLWLGIFPNSGYQLPDRSDIEGKDVDYRHLFNKTLQQITLPERFIPSTTGKIKVDFYFQWPPGWTNFESVIHAMLNNPAFDCQVVVVPYLNWQATDINGDIQRAILKDKGIEYIGFEDYSLEIRRPDVVFLQNPYDDARPDVFRSDYLFQRGVKIAYIPYALDTGIGEESMIYQYNLLCQNIATWIFARSQRHKDEFAIQCQAGNDHVYVTGHPKFDYYEERYNKKLEKEKGVTTLLWTTHFVLPGEVKMYTTFNHYCDAFIKLMMRDDIYLIIRPHPLFRQWINSASQVAQDNYERLVSASAVRNNVEWDFDANYQNSFSRSDALIADAGSFLLEYLPSKKPILYLTHETCHGLNRTADFIYSSYDVAWQEEDIHQFVNNIVNNIDERKPLREKVLQEELFIDDKTTAGDKIANIIYDALRGHTNA
ncbi:glycosyl transferase [Enterobacter asburiae]|nr:glycosyl transferase [Enterobacter asburiae]